MNRTRTTVPHDSKLDTRVVLSGLWVSMLFVFAYVDIFASLRADVINGALAGKVPGTGLGIDQTFLAVCTVYVLAPILMVLVSLLAPARVNRVTNIVVSLLYVLSIGATLVGETWIYYILGNIGEGLPCLRTTGNGLMPRPTKVSKSRGVRAVQANISSIRFSNSSTRSTAGWYPPDSEPVRRGRALHRDV